MIPEIELIETPDRTIRDAIVAPLLRFNVQQTGTAETPRPLAITLTDPDSGEIVGGLWGSTCWGWLHVELLFVPQTLRGSGTGRAILRQAEDEAVARGCKRVWLDTFSFQARGFYEKQGYAAFGTLDAYPGAHHRIFLTKSL